ncbi:nucleotide sugar dehydrogenase (plasmid) [Phaeobacter sp. BS23]|uniref:nucleotide sugar dehydrogenase n=1 Tax=Phaeobacter sp. BS23 TaxID=2907239 RepID=UPI003704B1A5
MSINFLISQRAARVGVIGLGYVGLPLAIDVLRSGYPMTGYDIDGGRIADLQRGVSYIESVSDSAILAASVDVRASWLNDASGLADCDIILVCVPTPLTAQKEPDLSYVVRAVDDVAKFVRRDVLVVVESTCYPGATESIVRSRFEAHGFSLGKNLFLGYSPEREDPGNKTFCTRNIPKIVSGIDQESAQLTAEFYDSICDQVVPVSDMRTAEAVKIAENVFRSVNIALINELKQVFREFGVDIWEVIDAASTKPFGYMPFFPGPGVGGHCIPIDPHYLLWAARERAVPARIVRIAAELNDAMPVWVVKRVAETIGCSEPENFSSKRILLVGIAYKRNVADCRESPALSIYKLLLAAGANVTCLDPHVRDIKGLQVAVGSNDFEVMTHLNGESYDAAIIVTDHDSIDFNMLLDLECPIFDTRNAMKYRGISHPNVVTA